MDAEAAATQREQREINVQMLLSRVRLSREEAHAIGEDAVVACWYAHKLCTRVMGVPGQAPARTFQPLPTSPHPG